MPIVRVFLGWERPLGETVAAHLLAGVKPGLLDLRHMVVVTPTRQAAWRLRGALPVVADAHGIALLGPDVTTPGALLEPPPSAGMASPLDELLAWRAAIASAQSDGGCAFLGARHGTVFDICRTFQAARQLQGLRTELADGGFSIAEVAAREDVVEEAERWAELADIERRYLAMLAQWGLTDRVARQLERARLGAWPSDWNRIILAAVPDPPRLLMVMLDTWAQKGGKVEILIAAPESEAACWDDWGRPIPSAWEHREISLREENIQLVAGPEDQAIEIARLIAAGIEGRAPRSPDLVPRIAIGVADREVIEPLKRQMADLGFPAFDPRNRPFADTPLFRLVETLLQFCRNPGYDETAALLRHPDVLASLEDDAATTLRALDILQSTYLPVTFDDVINRLAPAESDGLLDEYAAGALRSALQQLQVWRSMLTGGDLAGAMRGVLAHIYRNRHLREEDPSDALLHQSADILDEALRELETASTAGRAGGDIAEVLRARLQDETLRGERRGERVDLEGWLELAWNPAPLLFVAGMNEGKVPDGSLGDVFLPDTLRRRLGLRDHNARLARDVYTLTILTEQRRTSGRVTLLVGKVSAADDPLRPSRLLFCCPEAELVRRARRLFVTPRPSHGVEAFRISFALDPARLPPDAVAESCVRRMSATAFRDYLRCPLRFYLKHVLRMEARDDRTREPDAQAFGTLVHGVLEDMARDPSRPWAWDDAEALAGWLQARVRDRARRLYGDRSWLGVHLAVESAERRLRAFAEKQIAWHREGWDIFESPEQSKTLVLAGCEIIGRIDRIDRHRESGELCVLDYKTADQAQAPKDAHIGPDAEEDALPEARIPPSLLQKKTGPHGQRWKDLQLPLYCEMVRRQRGETEPVKVGYVSLAAALGAIHFEVWEDYLAAGPLHEHALQCAAAVIGRVRDSIFWPPRDVREPYDDFVSLLLNDPRRTIRPPVLARKSL